MELDMLVIVLVVVGVDLVVPSDPSLIRQSVSRQMVDPEELEVVGGDWIHLSLVMVGIGPDLEHYVDRLDKMLLSGLTLSQGTPLHLVIISDEQSVDIISRHVENTLAKALMERLLLIREQWKMDRYKLPALKVEFVPMLYITSRFRDTIDHMKKHFNRHSEMYKLSGLSGIKDVKGENWGFYPASKYDKDLFYLTPFYHLVFSTLDKMIIVDADVEFKYGIDLVYSEIDKFTKDQMYSFAPDLTPHYKTMLVDYSASHPETQFGQPGPMQGINTGVGLFNLARMRDSEVFNKYLELGEVDRMVDKFLFKGFIGDQDWWNLVVWDNATLFHCLDCTFNYQVTKEFDKGPYKEDFPQYHKCEGKIKIMHGHNL